MAKVYLVTQEIKENPSDHWIFKNERDAKDKVGELIGNYILDLLAGHNVDGAVEYVREIALMGDPYGFYTQDEEAYVEELEVRE